MTAMTHHPDQAELKACPFCGTAPIVIAGIIGCPECASGQPNAERWNRRVSGCCHAYWDEHSTLQGSGTCVICGQNALTRSTDNPPAGDVADLARIGRELLKAGNIDDALTAFNRIATAALAAGSGERMRKAAERGLEWAIEAANGRKKKDAVFDNAMRDIAFIEAALNEQEG